MSGHKLSQRIWIIWIVWVGCLLATLSACGSKPGNQSPEGLSSANSTQDAKQSATPAKSASAVRVYVDSKTGEIRDPTPEELAAEAAANAAKKQAAAANPQSEQPQQREVVTPSGAVEITLDPSAQRPLYGCIGKSGDLKVDHQCDQTSEDRTK
jgi:hypothetical protein